jgi:hypothetical protein
MAVVHARLYNEKWTRQPLAVVFMRGTLHMPYRLTVTVALIASAFLLATAQALGPPLLEPHNLDKLNTAKEEDDPFLASTNLILYYTSTTQGKSDVLVSRRAPGKGWPPGKPCEDINSKANTKSVFVTPEDKYPQRLFFGSTKNLDKEDQRGDNYDLFFVTKQLPRADFTFEEGLPFCTRADELYPWLSADGQQLYFSRKAEDGWRMFVASRPKGGGQFGKPKMLDLPAGFHHGSLNRDGKVMYLQGPLEDGRQGLFRTTRVGDGWAEPQPLAGLNHPNAQRGDLSPCLSYDGAYLFFASDRPGGNGGLDIWWITTLELNRRRN